MIYEDWTFCWCGSLDDQAVIINKHIEGGVEEARVLAIHLSLREGLPVDYWPLHRPELGDRVNHRANPGGTDFDEEMAS